MLEIKNLNKRYSKVYANKDINVTIPDNSVTLLVGPNGAGKSTLIKSIMGLLSYDGEIIIDGYSNKSVEGRELIAYIPELPHLYEILTVDEHLEFIARVYKLENWRDRADALLRRLDMYENKDKMGSELSKGMQQKLNIMVALLPKPKFVLLDEPMIGLDPRAIVELKHMIAELKAEGTSLLISTHILDTVDEIWDKVLIMTEGSIVAVADKEQLDENNETLEELFFRVTDLDHTDIKVTTDVEDYQNLEAENNSESSKNEDNK